MNYSLKSLRDSSSVEDLIKPVTTVDQVRAINKVYPISQGFMFSQNANSTSTSRLVLNASGNALLGCSMVIVGDSSTSPILDVNVSVSVNNYLLVNSVPAVVFSPYQVKNQQFFDLIQKLTGNDNILLTIANNTTSVVNGYFMLLYIPAQ